MRGWWLAVVAGCVLGARLAAVEPFAIRWVGEPPKVVVEVAGIPTATVELLQRSGWSADRWVRLLAVFAEQGDAAGSRTMPPMVGSWRIVAGRPRFEPRYPLVRGVRYRAEFRPAQLGREFAGEAVVTSTFELPAPPVAATTTVQQIYPSDDALPENQLKFYVEFSAPMRGGAIYEHIHLRGADGRDINLPFLEIDEELWNRTMTRLTLLIDPGRIKRGVKPLVDIGPVFEEGKSYSLTIDAAWRDAAGQPLKEAFRKEFRIRAPDRMPPDPARWTLSTPAKGTRDPLRIVFDEPMERALALRMIAVAGAGGEIAGEAALADAERRWTFVPVQPWSAGAHQLVVPTTIEDLAGNNIGKVFDVDVFEDVQRKIATASVKVGFEVK